MHGYGSIRYTDNSIYKGTRDVFIRVTSQMIIKMEMENFVGLMGEL